MKGKLLFCVIIAALAQNTADAQVIIRGRAPRGRRYVKPIPPRRPAPAPRRPMAKFEPAVHLTVGYGFPNLDKNELPEFYEAYKGTASQKGPITGAIDYQFSRRASIGVLVTHGEVKVPYYDYNNSAVPAMTGSLENWSFMLNLMRYLSAGKKVTPYIRTAIGINTWKQDFKDAAGNKLNEPVVASDFAYQAGLGAKFALSKNASLFAEAGYGKYIVQGGLSLKF